MSPGGARSQEGPLGAAVQSCISEWQIHGWYVPATCIAFAQSMSKLCLCCLDCCFTPIQNLEDQIHMCMVNSLLLC